jgi:hypothetical protein
MLAVADQVALTRGIGAASAYLMLQCLHVPFQAGLMGLWQNPHSYPAGA